MPVLFRRPAEPGDPSGPAARALGIVEVVRERALTTDFLPIADLESGQPVAYEAVPRGPHGGALERPETLAAAARATGLSDELDLVVHAVAFDAAVRGRLDPATALFIRAGTLRAGVAVPDDLAPALALAQTRLRVFTQVADAPLSTGTHLTVEAVDRVRAAGWGVALDALSLTAQGIALLPLVHPDVLKVPVDLLAAPHGPRLLAALAAHAERTGAVLLATGVDTEAQARTARMLGAALGQGAYAGRAGALPSVPRVPAHPVQRIAALEPVGGRQTPFGLATAGGSATPATGQVVAALAAHLEQRVAVDPDRSIVLTCLPRNRLLSREPLAALGMLARGTSFTAALVADRLAHPIPDVTVVRLPERDPLRDEWVFAMLGPHHAALLAAQERFAGPGSLDHAYRLVHDRSTVVRAVQLMFAGLHKGSPQPSVR